MHEDIYIYSCESLYIILGGKFKHTLTTCTFDKPFEWKKRLFHSPFHVLRENPALPLTLRIDSYNRPQWDVSPPALSKNAPLNDCNTP